MLIYTYYYDLYIHNWFHGILLRNLNDTLLFNWIQLFEFIQLVIFSFITPEEKIPIHKYVYPATFTIHSRFPSIFPSTICSNKINLIHEVLFPCNYLHFLWEILLCLKNDWRTVGIPHSSLFCIECDSFWTYTWKWKFFFHVITLL